ncbi:MAG: glycoside hydrolase family 13 protein [Clostridiales bacterium]|nr:glycoside hydrolase family 13 protein [Clostridiales bacterium]
MALENNQKIDLRALFADETSDYRVPEEPDRGDEVTVRVRTAKDGVDRVCLVRWKEGSEPEETVMSRGTSTAVFDYYESTFLIEDEMPVLYYFRITRGDDVCCLNRLGTSGDARDSQAFRITPGFHTPEWARGAVMYQIFVDRFCNGDPSNDVEECEYIYIGGPVHRVEDWNTNPSTLDVGCFYGGDLQGVWDKLDYLQYLGVEVIYFNPLFVSPSNHKYDSQDYEHIDPHYGVIVKDGGEPVDRDAKDNVGASRYRIRTASPENLIASDALFARLVEEMHCRGMRVIIDGVFNHCGSFNKWLDRDKIYEKQGGYEPGAYVSKDSPYHTFFKFNDETAWPDNASYDGWWGHSTLPKLNYEDSPKLFAYIMNIAARWVSAPFYVDGWRLDVAADLGHSSEYNHSFWRAFRRKVQEANPDALIVAEHYGDPSEWLKGDQWDTVMNYDAFMEPVTWFLTGMEKHSDEYNGTLYGDGAAFFRSMLYQMSRMQTQSVLVAMNQLSNHDHSRFLTRTNQVVGRLGTVGAKMAETGVNYGVFREGVLMLMTWPGAPTIYYGDETGVCGWTDPDNRRTFPWDHLDYELIEFHRYMIALHKRLPALRRGSVRQLLAGKHLIAYGRMCGANRCVVIINNRRDPMTVRVPVWEIGIADGEPLTCVMRTDEKGYNVGRVIYQAKDGYLTVGMGAVSGALFATGEEG